MIGIKASRATLTAIADTLRVEGAATPRGGTGGTATAMRRLRRLLARVEG